MKIDIGNALAEVASPGISREGLERLDRRVATIHRKIETERNAGSFGYRALDLPAAVDPAEIEELVSRLPPAETVVLVGIGGSALGAAAVDEALPSDRNLIVLDNVDPAAIDRLLADIDFERSVVHVVSRSGTTTETLANFAVVREAMESDDVDWTDRTLVTTGNDGPLRSTADRHDLPCAQTPEGVPGRYSVLSTVALPTLAILGVDIASLLAGGRAGVAQRSESLFESPAYAYGAVSYALSLRGARVNALMPYAESLETFGEWLAQLWAESLGKDGLGQLPARALGATDQHSQLQLYRAGPRNVQVTFLAVDEGPDVPVTGIVEDDLDYLGNTSLREILDVELRATEASLAAAGRPSVRLTIDRVDAYALGELLVGMEAACMMAGELFEIDPFDQPSVEWGKRAVRGQLGARSTREAQALRDKVELEIDGD